MSAVTTLHDGRSRDSSARLRRPLRAGAVLFAAGFVALNVLAWRHAYSLTHFAKEGRRTAQPEHLGLAGKLEALFTGAVLPRPANRRTPAEVGLAYETLTIPGPDGVPLEAWLAPRAGSRGLVLMFHGYADQKDSLLLAARAFHDMGYEPLLVDFRGSGGSGGEGTTIGWREAQDVASSVAWLRDRARPGAPVVLFGASMGAAAVLRAMAEEGVSPRAAIVQSPFDRLLTTVKHRFDMLGVPSFPAAHLLVFWGGWQQGFDGFRHNPVDYARRVRAPVLLLHGETDTRVRPEEARAIFDALPGPKEIDVFEGLGHESLLARRPERWRARVRAFLERFA